VVYVDDLLVFGTKQRIMKEKKELARNFEMHDLGKVRWFLAMEITHDRVACTITIDQRQYIRKILECFGLEYMQSVSMPMAVNIKLPKLETLEVDQHLYQLMLGSLMYMVIGTQPDIMFIQSRGLQRKRRNLLEILRCVTWAKRGGFSQWK